VCALLRCSVTLTLPEADDANNARLEVTEELLEELKGKEHWASAQKGRIVSYSLQRAKLMSKVIKYPGVPDYLRAVEELDAYTTCLMQVSLASCRNSHLLLLELYRKNEALLLDDPLGDQAFQSMLA
jgi:proteasome activator subunit 2 (PA28 beta)